MSKNRLTASNEVNSTEMGSFKTFSAIDTRTLRTTASGFSVILASLQFTAKFSLNSTLAMIGSARRSICVKTGLWQWLNAESKTNPALVRGKERAGLVHQKDTPFDSSHVRITVCHLSRCFAFDRSLELLSLWSWSEILYRFAGLLGIIEYNSSDMKGLKGL